MDNQVLEYMARYSFKKLQMCNDSSLGLQAVIAIHSTALGPAGGGTRMWTYASERDAVLDALRLARGMTYKFAAAGINLGGGKGVIIGDPKRDKNEALLRGYGRFVEQLNGEFLTGEDVGMTLDDMETIHTETDHMVTLPAHCGGVGPISQYTALGAVEATKACAKRVWGTDDLGGRRVALQGLGAVGFPALEMFVKQGAQVTVTDVDDLKIKEAQEKFGVLAVAANEIYDCDADVFAPYALGGVINAATIPRLKAKIVAGSANNILGVEEVDGPALDERGIVYAVDFVANSGGTIVDTDRLRKGGFQRERAVANVRRIYQRIEEIFKIAESEGLSAYAAANQLAQRRIDALTRVRLV